MRSESMIGTVEERVLGYAGKHFAGAKGMKKSWPASHGMPLVMRTAFFVFAFSISFALEAGAQVTPQRLLESAKEPQNWLMYSGDYTGRRFSALDQINTSNAAALAPKWAYQTMAGGKIETTPLVADGILYGTWQDHRAFALD